MGINVSSSVVVYPFTPSSRHAMSVVACVRDVFVTLPPDGFTGSAAGPRDRYLVLKSVTAVVESATYVFEAGCPAGVLDLTFEIPRSGGLLGVEPQGERLGSRMLVYSDDLPPDGTDVTYTGPDFVEVEPARVAWMQDHVKTVSFVNAYRKWDDPELTTPETLVKTFTGGVVALKSGYNVELRYDKKTGVLVIKGGGGLGKGLPSDIPWDDPPPNVEPSLISVNSLTGKIAAGGAGSSVVGSNAPGVLKLEI